MFKSLLNDPLEVSEKGSYFHYVFGSAVLLGLRFTQGFVFFAAGLRRFVWAPEKVDPNSTAYLAGKLLHAAPGAAFGFGRVIEWLMHHPSLLFFAVITFTTVETISGFLLIIGFMSRFASLLTTFLSVFLMMTFGWLGATCIDEWTMAAYGFASGIVMLLVGSNFFSLDAILLRRWKLLSQNFFLRFIFSGHIHIRKAAKLLIGVGFISIIFNVFFYSYYRGGIYSHLTPRTSPEKQYLAMNKVALTKTGKLTFNSWINAGPDTQALYLMELDIEKPSGQVLESWRPADLTAKYISIKNVFKHVKVEFAYYGLSMPLASKAEIVAKPVKPTIINYSGPLVLVARGVNGDVFKAEFMSDAM